MHTFDWLDAEAGRELMRARRDDPDFGLTPYDLDGLEDEHDEAEADQREQLTLNLEDYRR